MLPERSEQNRTSAACVDVTIEGIEERLILAEQIAILDETAGAWSDEKHPEMRTGEDIDRWLDDLRSSWNRLLTPDFCSLTPDA